MFFQEKNKTNKKQESSRNTPPLVWELWGILLGTLGLLFLLGLLSFQSMDQLYFAGEQEVVANWVGPGGHLCADFFLNFFGLQAFIIPIVFFLASYRCFADKTVTISPRKVIASLIIFLSLSVFFQLGAGDYVYSRPAGGLFGLLLYRGLLSLFSVAGTSIIALATLVSGLLLLQQWSLKSKFSDVWQKIRAKIPKTQSPYLAMPTSEAPVGLVFASENNVAVSDSLERRQAEIKIAPAKLEPESIVVKAPVIEESGAPAVAILPHEHITEKTLKEAERNSAKSYGLPPLNLLDYDAPPPLQINEEELTRQGERLCATFRDFGINGEIREIRPGPVVTLFEFVPAPGVKLSRISALADDIAMAMEAVHVRIVAPIPGKGAVGIELPNDVRETVFLKEIVADPGYRSRNEKLLIALGKDISGKACYANLAEMPHLLIAGTTGSGKSISVNAMICSILYRATPDDVKFLMIDPKMLELSIYEGIPHLLLPPIIDSKKAANALIWAVREMDRRYMAMSELGVRDISTYNQKIAALGAYDKHFPYIVIVVDEYADLVSVGGKDVEELVMRLAQKARASGIHVILATQRPSVDIITGVIKANFPVRIGFRLAASQDSKTIVNRSGAEKLLGKGDMLFMPSGTSDLVRVHGAYIF